MDKAWTSSPTWFTGLLMVILYFGSSIGADATLMGRSQRAALFRNEQLASVALHSVTAFQLANPLLQQP